MLLSSNSIAARAVSALLTQIQYLPKHHAFPENGLCGVGD